MEFNISVFIQSISIILDGLKVTSIVTLTGIISGLFLGVILAILRDSKNKIVSSASKIYINAFRSVPLLVVLSSFYLIGMSALKAKHIYTDIAMPSTLISFALFEAAYFAEIIRSGMNAIPTGQIEASRGLGFTRLQTYRLILIPQALKNAFSSIVTQSVAIFHDTTLCYVVGLSDLFTTMMHIGEKDGLVESAILLASIFYFIACVSIRQIAKKINN